MLAVLFTLNLLQMNVSIASFSIAFANIVSDIPLSVAIIPVEIEINGSGLS